MKALWSLLVKAEVVMRAVARLGPALPPSDVQEIFISIVLSFKLQLQVRVRGDRGCQVHDKGVTSNLIGLCSPC